MILRRIFLFLLYCPPAQSVKQLQKAGYKGFLSATARFEDQVEELREMGIHSVYNIFANVGAAYAEYAKNDFLSESRFSDGHQG